jgi:1-deoxy-D-xylulose-5-phosphate reductoisomerase
LKIAVLGSTGSIGRQTLDVVRANAPRFRVVGLAAHSNAELLEKQAAEFGPQIVALFDDDAARDLSPRLPNTQVLSGMSGLRAAAAESGADRVVVSISGNVALEPTLAAIESGRGIALATKEVLVSGGALVVPAARRAGVDLIPVDSEHSGVFQCLRGESTDRVSKITLTASGGPFLNTPAEALAEVTAEQALAHPVWNMGRKITIDSATLMNKGLEIIEAMWLFDLSIEQVRVVAHPQSIIHAVVEFKDGSSIAQLGVPDMRTPVQFALSFPDRAENSFETLNLEGIEKLTFAPVDTGKFECLRLAQEAAVSGGTMPCVMNAANEVAVAGFLAGEIGFLDIPRVVAETMAKHEPEPEPDLEAVLSADAEGRRTAEAICQRL